MRSAEKTLCELSSGRGTRGNGFSIISSLLLSLLSLLGVTAFFSGSSTIVSIFGSLIIAADFL